MTDIPARGIPAWIKWLIGLVACMLLGLICFEILNSAANARWQRYAAKLRESGLPLTLEELDASRTLISDDQNSAKLIETLAAKHHDRIISWPRKGSNVLFSGKWRIVRDVFKGIDRATIDPTREFLTRQSDILEDLQPLLTRPTGRFEFYTPSSLSAQPQLREWIAIRHFHRLMWAQATLALIDGDTDRAIDAIIIDAHISSSLDEYPTLIAAHARWMSVSVLAGTMIEQLLRAATLTDPQLERLQRMHDGLLQGHTMKWAWLESRATFLATCDALADGAYSFRRLVGGRGTTVQIPGASLFAWMPPMLTRKTQARGAEMYTWLIEAGDDPRALRLAARRFDAALGAGGRSTFLLKMLAVPAGRIVTIHERTTGLVRCAALAIATERFRLREGEFPTRLQDLVPDFLDEVPTDPFSGKAMLMTETEQGIVIYSVGENGTDDGGQVVPRQGIGRSIDVGLRLLRPEHRGLLLVDDTEQEEDP